MSWDSYLDNLLACGDMNDAAIMGHEPGQEGTWACKPGGQFSNITVTEVRQLKANDRSSLLSKGLTLGNEKYTVLRDGLSIDGEHTMDLRSKPTATDKNTYNVCIGQTKKAFLLLKGGEKTHGGILNKTVHTLTAHLRNQDY